MRPTLFAAVLMAMAATAPAHAETGPPPPFALPPDWQWDTAAHGVGQAKREFTHGYATIRATRSAASGPAGAALDAVTAAGSPPSERGEGETAKGQQLLLQRWTVANGVLSAVVLDDPAGERRNPDGAGADRRRASVLNLKFAGQLVRK